MLWASMGRPSNSMGEANNFRLIPEIVGGPREETGTSSEFSKNSFLLLLCSEKRSSGRNGETGNEMGQTACKPGSVPAFEGEGRPFIWDARYRTPRATNPGDGAEMRPSAAFRPRAIAPIRSCSRWGLPCRPCRQGRGALLPPRFTLAGADAGGLFSVALSLGLPPPGVTRHRIPVEPGLSSRRPEAPGGRPAV